MDFEKLPQLEVTLQNCWDSAYVKFMLSDADIDDGKTMAAFVALLKRALQNGAVLNLDGAPQLVAHNLYRIGFHPHQNLYLTNMREDEPYG